MRGDKTDTLFGHTPKSHCEQEKEFAGMNMTCTKTVAALCAISLPLCASGQNLGFMRDSLWSAMTAEDIASFRAFVGDAAEGAPDREIIEWTSPSGDLKGKVRSQFSYQSGGTTCRRMVFQISEGERRQKNHFDLCQSGDSWEVQTPEIRFSRAERQEIEELLNSVMEEQEAGVPVAWSNENSSRHVVIVAMDDVDKTNTACRRAAINISGGPGSDLSGQYRFCRNEDGKWRYQPE